MNSDRLLSEDEVMRRLKLLDGRPNHQAARRALDRLWRLAQAVRRDRKQPPLRRIKVGVRYLYDPDMVEALVEALSVAS